MSDKKLYSRKTGYGYRSQKLYLWSPETDIKKVNTNNINVDTSCTATIGSQGYDNNVGYVYNLIVVNGIQQKLAYVQCDYVQ